MQPSSAVLLTHGNASPCADSQERNPFSQSSDISPDGILRGLRWRVKLGVLPSGSPSVAELRRAAADGRRRYAELRRRLLVDPHVVDELHKPHHSNMDNPLSQDPESIWVRYFQNAELERTIDTDLTRLYPEHGVFFQSPVCQAMLRRILLVWSLIHPHYSYRQGMHEVLAPLLYVLHNDVVNLSKVKERYEDLFDDRFEDVSLLEPENGVKQRCQSFSPHKAILITEGTIIKGDEEWLERIAPQDSALLEPDEFGFDLRIMVLGSDTYGAEGELGALLSGRFVEHDTYSMFDALMSGKGGGINLADYFMTTNGAGSATSHSPVLEASAVLYRALAAADLSLYSHLVGLGVEPQYFALRWLRVLFGREFDLEKLLLLWDAIFSVTNRLEFLAGSGENNICQHSHRRVFILALAVSMLLYLRPILLAAANATGCLQKLLNFPETADVRVLIESAKALKTLVEEAVRVVPPLAGPFLYTYETRKVRNLAITGSNSRLLMASPINKHWSSPEILRNPLPESYWEEKWKNSVLQKGVPGSVGEQAAKMVDTSDYFVSPVLDQDASIASNVEGKQSLLVASAHSDAGSGSEHMLDNDSKDVQRKLHSGLDEDPITHSCNTEEIVANGSDHLEKSSGCRGFCGIQGTIHDTTRLQDSNGGLEKHTLALCRGADPNDIGGSKEIFISNKNMLLPHENDQEKLNTPGFDNATPRLATDSDVISASALVRSTTERNVSYGTIQGTASTELLVDDEASAYKAADKSAFAHAGCNESVVMNMQSKVQPLTHLIPLVSEDMKRISDSSMSASTSRNLPASSQSGKFSWMWNLCKTGSGDKKSGSFKSKHCKKPSDVAGTHENPYAGESLESKKEVLLFKDVGSLSINSPVGDLCSLACTATADRQLDISNDVLLQAGASEFMTNIGVMNESAKDGCFSDLRILGQSISENVMVIENTLSLMMTSKERLLDTSDERLVHVLESTSSAVGRTAVQVALEELKKISHTLLQM